MPANGRNYPTFATVFACPPVRLSGGRCPDCCWALRLSFCAISCNAHTSLHGRAELEGPQRQGSPAKPILFRGWRFRNVLSSHRARMIVHNCEIGQNVWRKAGLSHSVLRVEGMIMSDHIDRVVFGERREDCWTHLHDVVALVMPTTGTLEEQEQDIHPPFCSQIR